jgi:hypothetical protein
VRRDQARPFLHHPPSMGSPEVAFLPSFLPLPKSRLQIMLHSSEARGRPALSQQLSTSQTLIQDQTRKQV